jgi:hypothetical protein
VALEILFVERIFEGDDGITLYEVLERLDHFIAGLFTGRKEANIAIDARYSSALDTGAVSVAPCRLSIAHINTAPAVLSPVPSRKSARYPAAATTYPPIRLIEPKLKPMAIDTAP